MGVWLSFAGQMEMLEQRLAHKLQQRREAGTLRALPKEQPGLVDFSSNDYLGLARSQELRQKVEQHAAAHAHLPNGATGSRLLTGNHPLAEELEENMARLFKAPAALLFNSGYTANMAVLASLPQKGDVVFYDALAHACLKEGVRLSFAAHQAFRHNDLADLERRLQKPCAGQRFVVVESVYSMDGDEAPLAALVALCQQYQAHIILDEAHGTGVFGPLGEGLAVAEGLHAHIFARVHTFGKAVGMHGAAVLGPAVLKEYLINFARPYIYTTAMPPHGLIALSEALKAMAGQPALREALHQNILRFGELYAEHLHGGRLFERIPSRSAVQALLVKPGGRCKAVATRLQQQGFGVYPILPPTVKAGEERLRICLHAHNKAQELEALVLALAQEKE